MQVIFNRKVLALAIASSLGGFVAVDAQAVVTLDNDPATVSGITYAKEMIVDDTRPTGGFVNGGRNTTDPTLYPGALDIKTALGFGVGTGAPSYIRIELGNTTFAAGATFSASVGTDLLSSTNISQGGASSTSVVYAYTPQNQPGPNATVVISASGFQPTNKNDATATYKLYASAQDAASGSSNYLATSTGRLWTFGDSYSFTSDSTGDASPKIEVAGGSKYFVGTAGDPVGTFVAQVGTISVAENAGVYLADGVTQVATTAATIDVVTTGTMVKVESDMSLDPFLGSARKVFATTGTDCATGTAIYASTTATTASVAYFDVGNNAFSGLKVCVETAGTLPMDGGLFKVTYLPTADAATYTARTHDTLPMQKLVKNGKTFKVLLLPKEGAADSFFIRIYNTGTNPANVRATVYNEDGTLVGTANSPVVTGLEANKVAVVDVAKLQTAVNGTFAATGRGWARLEAESTSVSVKLMIRNNASQVLLDASASVQQDQ